jgi:TonB family protein
MKKKFANKWSPTRRLFTMLLALGIFAVNPGYAQEKDSDHNEVFTSVEHTPEFPGGMDAFYRYVASNIKYPAEARAKKVGGRVIATFVVEKDGTLSNFKSLRSPDELLSQEAVRVLAASPKWKPGTQNGHTVRVQYTVPIMFSIDGKPSMPAKPKNNDMPDAYYMINGKPATSSQMESLDVNSVESVNVLKGKTATDKYGEKGARGVIEIITKKP